MLQFSKLLAFSTCVFSLNADSLEVNRKSTESIDHLHIDALPSNLHIEHVHARLCLFRCVALEIEKWRGLYLCKYTRGCGQGGDFTHSLHVQVFSGGS